MAIRVRFAPSPTGLPHVGVIRTAIFDWLLARHYHGQFILRIEDTDRSRYVEGAVEEIIGALKWLGMDIDEGPGQIGGDHGPYFQSKRLSLYHRYADYLVESGKAYWCDCSAERLDELRASQEAAKQDIRYDNLCRELALEGSPGDGKHVLRFKIPEGGTTTFHDELRGDITVENATLDDLVLIKRDGFPTYHFACCIDDHHMAISHVLRGEEWIPSAPKHQLIYEAIGAEPPKFVHVPVILGPDKKKLSKRHGATNVLEYKNMGYLPEALFNFLALIGWNPGDDEEILPREELVEKFSVERINTSAGVFDIEKLDWMNGAYIRAMDTGELTSRLKPFMAEWGWIDGNWEPWGEDYVESVVELMKERMNRLTELREKAGFFFEDFDGFDPADVKKSFRGDDILSRLRMVRDALANCDFSLTALESAVRGTADALEVGAGKIIHPVRLAASGVTAGPGLFEMLELLGKDRVLARIDKAIAWVEAQ
ncbi:MAG TPA: glutamate--tRNA ligase [candidate division Zixibacteria bacterium]|nr:glutamate--tRNA ligase [candidate division Zixibacteria bacterium]